MDADTTEAALYYADMLQFEKQASEALKESTKRPLTESEQTLIAWLAGVKL